MEYNKIMDILEDLLPKLNTLTIEHMVRSGIKKDSDLIKSLEYKTTEGKIDLVSNNYWIYASRGRRAGTKKVPIRALINYIKDYGIRPKPNQSINQLAFAIQTAIYKQGINPKNYVDKVIDAASDLTEEYVADEVIELLADEVYDYIVSSPYAK